MTNIRDVSSFSNFIGNSLCNIFYEKKNIYIQFTTTRNRIREKRYSNRIERNLITRGGKVYFNPLFILIAEKSNAKHSYTGISIEKLPLIRLCIFERFDDYSHESYPSPGKEEALNHPISSRTTPSRAIKRGKEIISGSC